MNKTERRKCVTDNAVCQIPTVLIKPNREQPRLSFDDESITKLADSIQRYGVLQPLLVRKTAANVGCYELIAGERRLRAAMMLKLKSVPCYIVEAKDQESFEMAIIENMLRQDLNMFEEAESFKKLTQHYGLTQMELARRLSVSQSTIANKIRLLSLPNEARKLILDHALSERHARALLRIHEDSERVKATEYIISKDLDVSETELYIDSLVDAVLEPKSDSVSIKENSYKRLVRSITKKLAGFRREGESNALECEEHGDRYELKITIYK